MVKLSFALRRRPELSLEDFQRTWRQDHAPLVEKYREALRIRRYVQVHRVDEALNQAFRAPRGGPEAFDGVAELWWDSLEDLQAAIATPEGAAAGAVLLEDERRFIDLEHSPLWLGHEHVIFDA